MLREREATIQDITTQKENLESKVSHTPSYYFMPEAHLRGVQGIVEKQLMTLWFYLALFCDWLKKECQKKPNKQTKKALFVFIWAVVIFFFVSIGQRDYFGFGCATCNRIA